VKMIKSIMLLSIMNSTHYGKIRVMTSSVYPLALTSKITRFFMDLSPKTIIIKGVPSEFM
jgi:hypothetical protein